MFTSDRRFAFPPATVMLVTPTLSLPFGRNLPTGYGSSLTISVPFKGMCPSVCLSPWLVFFSVF
ncbi:hypothetical protein E2C01_102451 [Portunus trituberculatus]|uniref:Uncharacterized protein n=1 Tax=Portunus trituberculatus TaxID=210409 RepID=A0A5B7KIH6_PORTR|nr:hypothetical protein [Portunus trituberculatus]